MMHSEATFTNPLLKWPARNPFSRSTGNTGEKLFYKTHRPVNILLFVHPFCRSWNYVTTSVIMTSIKMIIGKPVLHTLLMRPINGVAFPLAAHTCLYLYHLLMNVANLEGFLISQFSFTIPESCRIVTDM